MIARIQQFGPLFEAHHGRYLLPLAGAALAILSYLLWSERLSRFRGSPGLRRARVALLTLLALAAIFSVGVWNNFFHYHYGGYVNAYEFFHHYLGSKYSKEVGYFDLYGAVLVADAEMGRSIRPANGLMTDLRSYRQEPVERFLGDAERYRAAFSRERWEEWRGDVAFFRKALGPAAWNRLLHDKGFNASPAWTMVVGGLFSRNVPTSSDSGMLLLALLDVVLLAGTLVCVAVVFGVRPALLAVVLLAASYLTAHVHMKGALLRTDFVVCLVLAVCMLKRRRHAFAGALVGCAAMSRLFPAVFLFGIGARLLWAVLGILRPAWEALRRRLGDRSSPRTVSALVLCGALLAGAVLTALLAIVAGAELRRIVVERLGSPGLAVAAILAGATLAVVVVGLASWGVRAGRLDTSYPRFFGGFASAVALLFLGSLVYHGGVRPWQDFTRKIELHRSRPHIWNVGFETVLQVELDPPAARLASRNWPSGAARSWFDNVVPLRTEKRERRGRIVAAIQLLALAGCFLVARRLEDHRALAFGFVPAFFLVAPTYYYYMTLMLPFLFFADRLDRARGAAGVVYLFLLGLAGFWFYHRWDQYFPTYYWASVLLFPLVLYMMAVAAQCSLNSTKIVK